MDHWYETQSRTQTCLDIRNMSVREEFDGFQVIPVKVPEIRSNVTCSIESSDSTTEDAFHESALPRSQSRQGRCAAVSNAAVPSGSL